MRICYRTQAADERCLAAGRRGGAGASDAGTLRPASLEFSWCEWCLIRGSEHLPDGGLVGLGELGEPVDASDIGPHIGTEEGIYAAVGQHPRDLGVAPPRHAGAGMGRALLDRCPSVDHAVEFGADELDVVVDANPRDQCLVVASDEQRESLGETFEQDLLRAMDR